MPWDNGIRWWKKQAFLTDLARRRAGGFGQPQLQEHSWTVVGEHSHPPHSSIRRSLFLTVQKWGTGEQLALQLLMVTWPEGQGLPISLSQGRISSGLVLLLFTECWLCQNILCYRCFLPPHSALFCSVAKSCLTLCNPMDCSTSGFPALHYLLEFAQVHVHLVSDAI